MHEVMAAVARHRYYDMPDPIETADDSDKNLPPAIRFVDYRGDFDDYFEINVIGPYADEAARDADLHRLRSLPDPCSSAQFFPCRAGSIPADETVDPAQIVQLPQDTMNGFFAAWSNDLGYLDEDEANPCLHGQDPDQLTIDLDEVWKTAGETATQGAGNPPG